MTTLAGGRGSTGSSARANGRSPWPRLDVRARAARPTRGSGADAAARLVRDRRPQLAPLFRSLGEAVPCTRHRPPRTRSWAPPRRTVHARGLRRRCRRTGGTTRNRTTHRGRLFDGRTDRAIAVAASSLLGRRARVVLDQRRVRIHCTPARPLPRRGWAVGGRRRRHRELAGKLCSRGGVAMERSGRRGAVGASSSWHGTTGSKSSRPVTRSAATTRGRGSVRCQCRRPSWPRRTTRWCRRETRSHWREAIPSATLRILPGGHHGCVTEPDQFVPALVDACREIADRSKASTPSEIVKVAC